MRVLQKMLQKKKSDGEVKFRSTAGDIPWLYLFSIYLSDNLSSTLF